MSVIRRKVGVQNLCDLLLVFLPLLARHILQHFLRMAMMRNFFIQSPYLPAIARIAHCEDEEDVVAVAAMCAGPVKGRLRAVTGHSDSGCDRNGGPEWKKVHFSLS